jgi:hypothetical protein
MRRLRLIRQQFRLVLCLSCALGLSACNSLSTQSGAQRAIASVDAVDETNLTEVMLTAGKPAEAERLFVQAVTYDTTLFAAKNNLVLARAAQRKYDLPVIQMTQTERAELYYTAGLAAVKQGDTRTGKQLLQTAIDTHPQYFEAAQRSLNALES